MASNATRKPDYTVKSSERYIDETKKLRFRSSLIGAAWINANERGEERINVKLHALPVNGELVLWTYRPKDEDANSEGVRDES